MMEWLFWELFRFFEYGVIVYVATINAVYFVLMVLGYFALRREHTALNLTERNALIKSRLVPAVSVLSPAFNEAATIRESVRATLGLEYPNLEVIVINDGSTDATLSILIKEFKLYRSSRQLIGDIPTKPIRGIYESRDLRLLVIDKVNGGKADSLNAGMNAARTPLVTAVDSDSLLETEALYYVVVPFLRDPRTIAVGGIVRVVNGCDVEHGRVRTVRTPHSMLARFQIVEYLRAFLGGRIAFSFMNSLLLVSGAFGLFRRDAILKVGGFRTSTVGEDMELVVRLHHQFAQERIPYKIVFVPDPVCWTEVPENLRTLHRQRNRWQRGTVETVMLHTGMLFNPRYGLAGLFGIPYFLAFEIIGPVVELLGYILTIVGLAIGAISWGTAALFFVVSVSFGIFLSIGAVFLEEFTLRRYSALKDVLILFSAAVLENFGFRQLLTVWRVQGVIDALRQKQGWGRMERKGFQAQTRLGA
jgi:cellulose synthase/poly-beta-1,6-N-acetylglucosamine synthase-like glycosyltransferase